MEGDKKVEKEYEEISDANSTVSTNPPKKKSKKIVKRKSSASVDKDDSELSDISTASAAKSSRKTKQVQKKKKRRPSTQSESDGDGGEKKLKSLLDKMKGRKHSSDSDSDSKPAIEKEQAEYTLGIPHKLGDNRDIYARIFAKISQLENKTLVTITPLVWKNGSLQKEKFAKSVSLDPKEYIALVGLAETLADEAKAVKKTERKRFKAAEAAANANKQKFFRKRKTGFY